MPSRVDRFWEGYITALSDVGYSYSAIIKRCKDEGMVVSKTGIHNILKNKGKQRNSNNNAPKSMKKRQPQPCRTRDVVRKVKALVTGENPATQRAIASRVGTSQATVSRIVSQNLNLERRHKARVHKLSLNHIADPRSVRLFSLLAVVNRSNFIAVRKVNPSFI